MWCALRFYLVALLATSTFLPEIASAALRINEVLPAPASDWDGDMLSDTKKDEWVEIINAGLLTEDLSGYFLFNGPTRAPVYGFVGLLPPGGMAMVSGRDAVLWETEAGASAIGLSLNNAGDVVYLARVSGVDTALVDSLAYSPGEVGYDVSIGRSPDGGGAWVLFDHLEPMGGCGLDPTPQRSNTSDPPPHILDVARVPPAPAGGDSVSIRVRVGDASSVSQVLLCYQINLQDGEEPQMELSSGSADLGTWSYTILPCAAGDTVRYKVSAFDASSSTISPWIGYRVRSGGLLVKINEVLADPPADAAGDANRDGVRDAADDEFVEIVNCGSSPVDISGWKIRDDSSVRHTFQETPLVIMPGEFVTVFGGGSPGGFTGRVYTASSGGLGLNNTADIATLVDATGLIVDLHSYGSEGGMDQSMIRYPDCADVWTLSLEAAAGVPFTPQSPNGGLNPVAPSTWGNIKTLFR